MYIISFLVSILQPQTLLAFKGLVDSHNYILYNILVQLKTFPVKHIKEVTFHEFYYLSISTHTYSLQNTVQYFPSSVINKLGTSSL